MENFPRLKNRIWMCQKSIFVELSSTVWPKLIDRMAICGQQKMLGYCIRDKIRFIKSVFYDIVSEALKFGHYLLQNCDSRFLYG